MRACFIRHIFHALIMTPFLSGCNNFSGPMIKSDYCTAYEVVYVVKADVLTDGTARPILNNNETWRELCTKK